MSSECLNVIALISGGKDSFFSLLHCIQHGHRIVALANLYPPTNNSSIGGDGLEDQTDLNSFMYQTVGHQVIPLYGAATNLPLYRQAINGVAVHHERDYDVSMEGQVLSEKSDETESMLRLLQDVIDHHPEANALCSGAILSTYQRTRVESVALRLGLCPLAYLWKYPVLPPPLNAAADEAQLLYDMATAGLEARIIKVASAGLDETHLWEQVSSSKGVTRLKNALRKFGPADGAVLGEGGEFETLVLDGPSSLFGNSIVIPANSREVVYEGGGSTWLMLREALLQEKPSIPDRGQAIRVPDLLDSRFQTIFDKILNKSGSARARPAETQVVLGKKLAFDHEFDTIRWSVVGSSTDDGCSIEMETQCVTNKIRELLASASVHAAQITNTVVILRNMSDFPRVNAEYGKLFTKPNPPSRVTISCGELLPAGHNIMVFLTVPKAGVMSGREGLHVQSRSYWAPANIGPYSQAIDVAVTAQKDPTGLRSIYVAGQIPLLPATMSLPAPSETSLHMQIVLSLQHLWRIGIQMKVQYWTSAIAYFARSSSATEMEHKARLAGVAWDLAHGSPADVEEDENGADPWDLKYNSQHMTLGGNDGKAITNLPDWSIFTLQQQNEPESCLPPMFAVEVEELPRNSTVEWHAHVGLSHVEDSNLRVIYHTQVGTYGRWRVWHVVAQTSKTTTILYTSLAKTLAELSRSGATDIRGAISEAYKESVCRLGLEAHKFPFGASHLTYVDTASATSPVSEVGDVGTSRVDIVPCRSIWSVEGERLECVAMYQASLHSLDA